MMFGQPLVVADQAAVTHQPSECSLDDPAAGYHDESAGVVATFDHRDSQPEDSGCPSHQAPGVTLIFLPPSKPLLAAPTVSEALTDCESIEHAVGSSLRPAATRNR
ncbi:MAG: hypothetical protein M3Z25_21560, partial [Actinomycetota bacterium]|nr:hypothetical protein [Actinomycetota bacterium]